VKGINLAPWAVWKHKAQSKFETQKGILRLLDEKKEHNISPGSPEKFTEFLV
jgi:hypothetical protein